MEEKKKSNKGLKIILVILILIVIACLAYIGYDKYAPQKTTKKDTETKEETKSEDLNKISQELIQKYNLEGYFMWSKNSEKSLYDVTNTTNKGQFSELMNIAFAEELSKIEKTTTNSTSEVSTITKDQYNEYFKKTFGPDVEIISPTKNDMTSGAQAACGAFHYNPTADNYETTHACGGTIAGYVGHYYLNPQEEDGILTISFKETMISNVNKPNYIIVLKNNKEVNLDQEVKDINEANEIVKKYADYLDSYQFQFKKASDGNYYFYKNTKLDDGKTYQ